MPPLMGRALTGSRSRRNILPHHFLASSISNLLIHPALIRGSTLDEPQVMDAFQHFPTLPLETLCPLSLSPFRREAILKTSIMMASRTCHKITNPAGHFRQNKFLEFWGP